MLTAGQAHEVAQDFSIKKEKLQYEFYRDFLSSRFGELLEKIGGHIETQAKRGITNIKIIFDL